MNNSVRGNQADAEAGTFGGCTQTASANFSRTAEDAMAASIVHLLGRLAEVEAERDFYKAAAGKLMHNGRRKK